MKRALMMLVAGVLAMGVFLGAAEPAQAKTYTKKTAYKPTKKYSMAHKKYKHTSYHVHFSAHQGMMPMMANTEGKILVTWDARGGTCNFAYTESDQTVYKYKTSSGCDNGMVWIGGLDPGKSYKVTMAQGNWTHWHKAKVAKAVAMPKH